MKKPNRIAGNGDSARKSAQAKRPARKPAKAGGARPSAKGTARIAHADPLIEVKAARTRRSHSQELVAELKKFLTRDAFTELAVIHAKFGVTIEQQLASALGSWLGFIEHHRRAHYGYTAEFFEREITEFARVLDPDQTQFQIDNARRAWVSNDARKLYVHILTMVKRWEAESAAEAFRGLSDLLSFHPGFADEVSMLDDAANSLGNLGQSAALYEPPAQRAEGAMK